MKKIIRKIINKFFKKQKTKDFYNMSFSQSGEDIIIEYLFRLRKITSPSFLDIGAYDPTFGNNTYKFYLNGSKGVNIDADPSAITKFNLKRIKDINLNIGVGSISGLLPFYIMEESSLNTFSKIELDNLLLTGQKLKNTINIAVLPINEVFEKYFNEEACDLLSIDAEGVDFEIIQAMDFNKYAPKVICIETINYTPDGTGTKREDLCSYIESKGYYEYANTNINSIFIKKGWWFNKSLV
jgi:FkbM family methyltransferase